MKRLAKAWLAVGVGCCVCGAALTGIGVASGGSKYVKSADLNKMDGAAKKSDNEMVLEKTKLDDFDSADISMTDMNLQVVSSDDQIVIWFLQRQVLEKQLLRHLIIKLLRRRTQEHACYLWLTERRFSNRAFRNSRKF